MGRIALSLVYSSRAESYDGAVLLLRESAAIPDLDRARPMMYSLPRAAFVTGVGEHWFSRSAGGRQRGHVELRS